MRLQKTSAPDKPFFMYFSPGACHAPHHVHEEWIDRFSGQFDGGWDVLREEIHARQLAMGVIPAGTALTPRPEQLPGMGRLRRPLQAGGRRLMECFAGFLAHTDAQVGRLIDALEDLGEWDNTLFIYVSGDNGASAEGTLNGVWSAPSFQNGFPEDPEWLLAHIDDFGSARCENHFNVRVGVGAGRTVPVDQAGRLPLRRHPQRARRSRGRRVPRPAGSAISSTTSSTSCRRSSTWSASPQPDSRERRRAEADRGCQHALQLRRRRRRQHADDAVLRDSRQPSDLPRRLDRLVLPRPGAVDPQRGAALRRWRRDVGAVQRPRRLQPGGRPRRAVPRRSCANCGRCSTARPGGTTCTR